MALTKVTYSMINGAAVNVLDYGAIGDGVTDDTAAIQTAINTGLPVYLPAGQYKLTTTITNTSNLILFGDGSISVAGNDPQTDKSGVCINWTGADAGPVFNINPDVATSLRMNNIKIYVNKTFTGKMINVQGSLVTNEQARAIMEVDGLGLYRTPLDYTATFAPGDSTAIGIYFDLTSASAGESRACVGYKFSNMYLFNLNCGIKVEVVEAVVGQANFFNSNYFNDVYMYQVYRALDLIGGSGADRAEVAANTFISFQVQPGADSSSVAADGCVRIEYKVTGNVFIGLKIWDIPENKKLASSNLSSDANGFFINRIYGVYTGDYASATNGFSIEDGIRNINYIPQYQLWNIGGATKLELNATELKTRTDPIRVGSVISIPAGGTTGLGFTVSFTPNFGVFFGSGAPTLSAAKGSLYLRSDGTTTNDRMYVNTNGATTWTSVTTAA
jgi:hypothetical protein